MEKSAASTDLSVTKRRVIAAFEARLKETLEAVITHEESLKESSENEEEYSADRLGRKQEEIMDDVEQHDMIAANAKDRLLALNNLNADLALDMVDLGALVITDQARMLVCVALEPVEVDGQPYTGVSIQAPLVQALMGKRAGEEVELNGRRFKIEAVG